MKTSRPTTFKSVKMIDKLGVVSLKEQAWASESIQKPTENDKGYFASLEQ